MKSTAGAQGEALASVWAERDGFAAEVVCSGAGLVSISLGLASGLEAARRCARRKTLAALGAAPPAAEPRGGAAAAQARRAAAALQAYLDDRDPNAEALGELPLDLRVGSDFERQVWGTLRAVGRGRTISYGELASAAGRPGAARAVGRAMSKNPCPIVVPCHRVLAAGRRLGGFTGGLAIKRRLLRHEGASWREPKKGA